MNVLTLVNYFDRDGGTTQILAEGKYLSRLHVRLCVAVPCNPFARVDIASRLRAAGLPFLFVPTHFRTLYWFLPFSLWRLWRFTRRQRIDVIHAHHGRTLLLATLLARLAGVPLVYSIHGISRRELPRGMKRHLFRRVCRVLAVSEECAEHFRRQVPSAAARVIVVRNSVDCGHFRPLGTRRPGGDGILYISRLDRDKRRAVEAAMAAAARLAAAGGRIRLHVVGAGRQGGAVRRRAREINARLGKRTISVAGWADDPLALYAAADAVIGVGRCVLEAAAVGRPVLVAGSESIGGWVRPCSFAALQAANFSGRRSGRPLTAEALAGELALPPPGESERAACGELVRRDHNAECVALEIRALYRQALDEAGVRP